MKINQQGMLEDVKAEPTHFVEAYSIGGEPFNSARVFPMSILDDILHITKNSPFGSTHTVAIFKIYPK